MEPRVIAGSRSPNGNLQAFVEQDDRCAYLYLSEVRADPSAALGFGMRACWVRNLKPAPASASTSDMQDGLAPMMPASTCAHPRGAKPLAEGALRIVWFEEGDAAAVVEGDAVLAVIPCWSGQGGFHGYARDCTAESPLAWPLAEDNVLIDRVRHADACWRAWETGDPWAAVRDAGVQAISAAFGEPANYYAIDGGEWPPRALLRCVQGDAVVLVTCGVQLRPQPRAELHVEDPRPVRRIELGLALDRRLFDLAPREVMGWLSGQAAYPWHRLTWFGHHHTMPCRAVPPGPSGRAFPGMLLLRDPPGAPRVALPAYRGDPVTILWLVPITAEERALAEREGSGELARRLAAGGHGFIHRDRPAVE